METATIPNNNYPVIGINTPQVQVNALFSYANIYKNSNNGFALEFRKQMITLHEQGLKLNEIAENLNCSMSVVKKWLRRYREGALISDKSRAPLHSDVKNTQFNQYCVKEILAKYPFYGSRRIAHEIEKDYGIVVSHVTISQMMKEIADKKPIVIPDRIEIEEPDAIWHLDMTPMRIAKGRKQYIFATLDACTRRVMAIRSYDNATTVSAIDCMNAAIEFNNGKKPRILYTDNGRMFISKSFEELLKQKVIFHHKIDKGSPWQNGKVERLFGTLFREWITYRRFMIPESLYQSLGEFQNWFNNEREIQKLGYKTPMQIMSERTTSF